MRSGPARYLRYLHLRDYVSRVADEIETMAVCGTGTAWSELAIAVEFPHLQLTLTDIIDRPRYPSYHAAMAHAWSKGIDNVSFTVWDVLQPTKRRFDLVCSTEMLEHIKEDAKAAENMRKASRRYTYCLVPYADAETNADTEKRKHALEKAEHFVCGYDEAMIRNLFPTPVYMGGAYWPTGGGRLNQKLRAMTPEAIDADYDALAALAGTDLRDVVPQSSRDAMGIKVLCSA